MATLIQVMRHTLDQSAGEIRTETRRIILKELLQAYVLNFVYNHPEYKHLLFYGGTCNRVVYGLNRLSEDLDFDNTPSVDLSNLEVDLLNYFYTIIEYKNISINKQSSLNQVHRWTLKFPLLYELGLSEHLEEKLHLKIEVSSHNQVSRKLNTPILFHGNSMVINHHSEETLMAGKMLACIQREFRVGDKHIRVKGRDYYDLLWFMQKRVIPLEEKLFRDGETPYTIKDIFAKLTQKVQEMNEGDLRTDLNPLFENREYISAWIGTFKENFFRFEGYYQGLVNED